MDDVASPQKCCTLNDRGNTLNSRGGVHEDIIGEAPKEDMSQENTALALKYCHDTSSDMLVIPMMVMSSMQTNEDIDGKGEAGDAVDDVGGEEDEELGGDGDVVNQPYALHRRKVTGHKKQWKQ